MKLGVRLAVVLAVASFPAAAQAEVIAPHAVKPTVVTPQVSSAPSSPAPAPTSSAPASKSQPAFPDPSEAANLPPVHSGPPHYDWSNPPPAGSPETVEPLPDPGLDGPSEHAPWSSDPNDFPDTPLGPDSQAWLYFSDHGLKEATAQMDAEIEAEAAAKAIIDGVLDDLGWGGGQTPQSEKDEYDKKKEE